MIKKLDGNVFVALCTVCIMMAFAFYRRFGGAGPAATVPFDVAAAVVLLLSVGYGLLRHKTCESKS